MVAIFTGNGLGLFNASVGAGSTRLGQSRDSFSINAATGNLVLQGYDEGLVVRGLGAAALRTYNSRGDVNGAGQDGWVTGYERRVQLEGGLYRAGSVVRHRTGEGDQIVFAFDASRSAYVATAGDGAHDVISWDDGWHLSRDGNSSQREFFESGVDPQTGDYDVYSIARLREFGHNQAIYIVNYDALGRVSDVASTAGYPNGDAIVYSYVGNTQQLAAVSTRENGVTRTQVTYGYDGVGRLSWVQTDLTPDNAADNEWVPEEGENDHRLFRTTYEYTTASASDLRIARVTGSDSVTAAYTYEADGAGGYRVKTVTEGSATDGSARTLTFVYGTNATDVIDAAGRTWTYQYDANKRLIAMLEPAVNGMRARTGYEYDAAGNVIRITGSAASGTTTGGALTDVVFRYDANGNRILQRDLLGNTTAWAYNEANQLESETRYTTADTDGLDPTHSGTTNLPSGALTTRYVYESEWSDRVRFVINAEGEVRELTYGYTAPHYDGLLSSERRYLGDRYAGTTFTNQALTAWTNDAAARRRANSSLTSYAYDAKGRLQQTVEYATVSADATGNGVLDAGATITRYTHDAQGLLRQKIVSRGAGRTDSSALAGSEVTEYVYDGMGRLLSMLSRDAASTADDDVRTIQATYAYTDSRNWITVTSDTGLRRIELRNSAGDVRAVWGIGAANVYGENVNRITSTLYTYDETGRLRATEDAAGGRSYFFYDDAGRLIATVDPTGAVSRMTYDELGRKVETIAMENRADTSTWLANGTVAKSELVFEGDPATLAGHQALIEYGNDRSTYYSYDDAGRLAATTDAFGLVTSYVYDGASRLISTSQTLPSFGWDGGITKKGVAPVLPEVRTTRFFYDNADRLIGTLDAEGYLTESIFDAGGRLVKTVRYATATNSAHWDSGTLAQLRPINTGGDQSTRYFYDARGRQIGMLNAEGYLTESLYDEVGNARAVKEYAKRLTGLTGSETLLALRTAAVTAAPAEAFRLTQNSYNGMGQLATSLNHEGTVTRYTYDEAGRLVKTEAAQGTSEVREGYRRYDMFGHLIGELNGEDVVRLLPGMSEAELDAVYAQYGVRHSYDLLSRRIESIDSLGNKTWYFYDANSRQTFTVRGVEDSANIRNAQGEVSETRYNAFGEVTDTIAYTGRITIAIPGDRASAQSAISTLQYVAAQDSRAQFVYDGLGRLAGQYDAENYATRYAYNSFGDLTSVSRFRNSGQFDSGTTYAYDRRGLRTGQTDRASGLTRSVSNNYDAFGRVTRQIDARGTTREMAYDRLGRQVSTTTRGVSGQDLVQTSSYDAFNRMLNQTDATGRTTSYSYSDSSRSVTVTSPEGVSITTLQNRFGQTVEVQQPQPGGTTAITRSVYDRDGNLTQQTDPLGNVARNAYDVRGLLATSIDASGRQISYSYDAVGRTLTRVEDRGAGRLNLTTRYEFDGQGRTVRATDASGRVVAMSYDRKGQLIEQRVDPDGLNLRTTYTWDHEGRQLSVIEGAGTAAARQTVYAYDGFGRRIRETVGTGSAQVITNYQYDTNDNLLRKTGAGGTVQFAYDAANRLRFSIDATGGLTEQIYDRAGRIIAQRSYAKAVNLSSLGTAVPIEGQLVSFVATQALRNDAHDLSSYQLYDGDGRVRLSIDGTGGVVESVYDSAGRRIAEKRYATAMLLSAAQRDALAAGTATVAALLAATQQNAQTNSVVNFFYDANGNVVRKTGAGGTVQFAYDAANRLRFTVDATGGLTEQFYDRAGRGNGQRSYAKAVNLSLLGTAVPTEAQLVGFIASQALRDDTQDLTTYQVYDADGRVRLSIDGTGGVVENVYDSAGRRVVETRYAASLTLSLLHDSLAAGTATIASLLAETPQNAQTDSVMRYFYDASNRVVYTVDGNGGMTRMWYDTAGRVVSTRQFAKPANVATLATATIASLDAQIDLAAGYEGESRVYDGAGRLRFVIAADGVLRETRYDAAGRVVSSLRYFASASTLQATLGASLSAGTAQVTDFAAFVAANEATAASSHSIYDAANRQRLSITRTSATHAAVVEQQYDAAGRMVGTYAYTALLSVDATLSSDLSQGTATEASLSTWLSANRATAQIQRMVYDAAGRVAYSIDGAGAVTSTRYNTLGMVASVRQHAQAVTLGLLGTTLDAATVASALVETAQDRIDYNVYDAAARTVFRTHADGSLQEIRYDAIGRVRTTLAYTTRLDATVMAQVAAGTATQASFAAHVAANEGTARAEGLHYDQAGRVRYQVMRSGSGSGQVTETQYDAIGREIAKTRYGVNIGYALGETTDAVAAAVTSALSTDATVRATQIRSVRYFYDAANRQRFAVDPSGALTEQRFDGLGRVTQTIGYGTRPNTAIDTAALATWVATQPASSYRTVSMAYDLASQVTTRTDALGQSEFFQYDAAGNITRHTDRAGAVWSYEYDRAGRRAAEISPAVAVSTATGGVTTRSIVTRMEYDGVKNMLRRIENADTAQTRITRYEYDNRGHTVRIVLPDPATGLDPVSGSADTIEIAYDTLGQAVSEKDALGNRSYKVYDTLGRVIYDIDQELQVTSHVYNAFGEETRSVRHARTLYTGHIPAYAGAGSGDWVAGQGQSQTVIEKRLTKDSSIDRGVDSSYNLLGQKVQVQQDAVSYVKSDGSVANGRPTLRTQFNAYGEAVRTSVLLEGTPDTADAVWADTYRFYDALGRETVSVDAEGYVNSQTWDAYGEIQGKIQHARKLDATTLSTLGTVLPPTLPTAGDAVTGYDRQVSFVYDKLGRVLAQTVKHWSQPSSASAATLIDVNTQFGYDAEGRTISITDSQGTTTNQYDALGRMISVQQPSRAVVTAQADALLGVSIYNTLASTALYEQRSPYTELAYDAFGNTVRVQRYADGKSGTSVAVASTKDQITETDYDHRGRIVAERDLAAGTISTRTYDAGDRVVGMRTYSTTGLDNSNNYNVIARYTYDKVGRQLSSATGGGQFSTEASEIVRYNAFGEITGKDDSIVNAFAVNTPYVAYEYDNAGRMLSTNAQGGALRHSAYDLAGRMVRASQASVTVNAQGVEQVVNAITNIRYDKLGRAIRQELPSNSDDLNQRPVIVREYDRWGNVVRNVDARGYETQIRYNSQDKAVQEIRPEVKVVNANGTEVRIRPTLAWYYDSYGRLTESRDANGHSQRMVYDNAGRVVQSVDALGNVTRMAYDVFDRERYTQNPLGYITWKAYDNAGRVNSHGDFTRQINDISKRQINTLETYGLQGSTDRWSVTNALGHTARYNYDSRHLLTSSYSAAGVAKHYAYNLQGVKSRESNGAYNHHRYLLSRQDVNGTLTGQTSSGTFVPGPGGGTYVPTAYSGPNIMKDREGEYVFVDEQTWDYDIFGRLVDHNDLGGADYDYIYHEVTGQLIRTTRATSSAINVVLEFGYVVPTPDVVPPDKVSTAASLSLGTLGASERVQFYYASGLVKEIREGGNWTRYAYDESGNRTMEETYTRDSRGNLVWLRTVSTYDSQGRLSMVRQFDMDPGPWGNDVGKELSTVRYSYDAVGNRRRVSVINAGARATNAHTSSNAWGYVNAEIRSDYSGDPRFAPETTFDFLGITLADGSPLPSWLTFNPVTRELVGTPTVAQTLTLRSTWRSIDDNSVYIRDTHLQILPSQPPQLTFHENERWHDLTLNLGQGDWTFATAGGFIDPDGLPLRYSAKLRVGTALQPLPAGMQIDATTGVITGMPAVGDYQIVVTATDADNQSVDRPLNLSVEPWQLDVVLGDWLNVYLPESFATRNGQPPTGYVVTSVNNGAVPSWLQLQQYSPGEWTIVGTPPAGTFHVNIRAVYADGSTTEKTMRAVVQEEQITVQDRLTSPNARIASDDITPGDDNGDNGDGNEPGGLGINNGGPPPARPGPTYINASYQLQSYWYNYDAMNRVTVVNGTLQDGQITLGKIAFGETDISYSVQYDDAGRETLRTFLDAGVTKYERTVQNERGQRTYVYKPTALGAVEQQAQAMEYDAAGRLTSRKDFFLAGSPYASMVKHEEKFEYDADGRTLVQRTYGFRNYIIPIWPVLREVDSRGDWVELSAVSYDYDLTREARLTSSVYHHKANEWGTGVTDSSVWDYTFTYNYRYDAREAYLETRVNGTGTANFTPGSTASVYDSWGRRVEVQDGKERLFAYDASGNIIQRKDGTGNYNLTRYAFVGGQQVSASNGGFVDAVSTLTAYRNSESGSSNITVQGGDTLRSIAGRVYGNESLWYVLASANALDGSETLTAGTTLKVPEVKVNKNDADTFKPYNPGEVIGSTTPSIDYVAPPPKEACSKAGKIILAILVVIVVVIVTIYTAGALAGPAAGGGAAVLGGTAAAIAALGVGGVIAVAAVAGAVGALAGQLVNVAFNPDAKFDWGAVALGGLTTAATAGFGTVLSGASTATKGVLAYVNNAKWARAAAQAVVSNVANYGANWAINRVDSSRDRSNEKFNWANLAADTVSGALNGQLGEWGEGIKNVGILKDTVTGFVTSATRHGVQSLLDDPGSPEYGQMLIDSFGNALAGASKRGVENVFENRRLRELHAMDGYKSLDEKQKALVDKTARDDRLNLDLRDEATRQALISLGRADSSNDTDAKMSAYEAVLRQSPLLDDAKVNTVLSLAGKSHRALSRLANVDLSKNNVSGQKSVDVSQLFKLGDGRYYDEKANAIFSKDASGDYVKQPNTLDEVRIESFNKASSPVALGLRELDSALIGIGEVAVEIGGFMKEYPWIGVALDVADFISSPIKAAANKLIAISPLGEWLDGKIAEGTELVARKFVTAGYSLDAAVAAAAGAVVIGGLIVGGIKSALSKSVNSIARLERLVQKIEKQIHGKAIRLLDKMVPSQRNNTGVAGESAAVEGSVVNPNSVRHSAERFTGLVDEFAGRTSMRGFSRWKQSLLDEGLSATQISDIVYEGSLKRGSNPWGGDWKKYYQEITGTIAPEGMVNPHAHHLVEKAGTSLAAGTNREILREVGINPLLNRANFTWAPNVTGMHGTVPQTRLMNMLEPVRGNPEGINRVLQQWATIAATHQ